jgi:hypothetical protein
MFLPGRVLSVLAVALVLLPAAATAESPSAEEAAPVTLPEVEVVGATPLLGSGVDRDKVPAQTHVLTDRDISRDCYPQALRALNEDVPGVTLDAAAGPRARTIRQPSLTAISKSGPVITSPVSPTTGSSSAPTIT